MAAPILMITGGIGSGKSAIADMFAELGAGVVRMDDVGHGILLDPNVRAQLAETFGPQVLDQDGAVIKPALAAAAFDTPEHTHLLNGITHPAIIARSHELADQLAAERPLVVVEVSAGEVSHSFYPWATWIAVVTAPVEVRVARALARGNQTEDDIRARMSRQPSDQERLADADLEIPNAGSLDDARALVCQLFEQCKKLPGRNLQEAEE